MTPKLYPSKTAVQELREFILSIDGRIKEQVKWNVPSFYLEDNFATLRVHPVPIVQLVLHNGSKKKVDQKPFEIPDPHGIFKWVAKDRCTVTFSSLEDARSKMDALRPIIVSWIPYLRGISDPSAAQPCIRGGRAESGVPLNLDVGLLRLLRAERRRII